ncbi:MAG: hypothetical protein H0U76_22250 [Ktedonobacteraceae bacterium]|nr:hypothetical protein [Ktedonobacteraceae bacterium]
MEIPHETSFEREWKLWRKGERVAFKAYPALIGIVEEEDRLYPFVLWPGEDRAHAIHASEILLYESESEQPPSPASKEDAPADSTHAVLYRGENGGLFLTAKVSSFTPAHDLARALTAATGQPHWVDPLDAIVQTEGSNRIYWK